MATIYNETDDNIQFSNKTLGKKLEEVYFTLQGEEKEYHITVKGESNLDVIVEVTEKPHETTEA